MIQMLTLRRFPANVVIKIYEYIIQERIHKAAKKKKM